MNCRKNNQNDVICDDLMTELLRHSEIFRDMPDKCFDDAIKIIDPYYSIYSKNELIVRENEVFDKLAVVYSGKFVSVRNDYGGKATAIKEYNAGDIIGLNIVFSKTKISPTVIQATAPLNNVIFLDLKTVLSPTYPDKRFQYTIHTNLMRAIAEDSVKNIYKIDIITKKTIRERVLAYLFIVMKKSGKNAFRVDMDREHLAQYLGVTRSALSHELSKMRSEGLIECERDWFEIKDSCIENYVNSYVSHHRDEAAAAQETEAMEKKDAC